MSIESPRLIPPPLESMNDELLEEEEVENREESIEDESYNVTTLRSPHILRLLIARTFSVLYLKED